WQRFDWVWPSSTTTAQGLPTQPRLQYARMIPGLGMVQGIIRDDSGAPLKDVSITAQPGDYRATSLPDGSYLLLAAPGQCILTAQKEGYGSAALIADVSGDGSAASLNARLPAQLSTELRNSDFEQPDLAGWTTWGDVDGVQAGPWFFDVEA